MATVPLNLQRQHAIQMLLRRPFATFLDRLPDQPQDSASAPGIGVELDLDVPAVLVLVRPSPMVAAGQPMGSLCDLDYAKFLRAVRARVFLNEGGDG